MTICQHHLYMASSEAPTVRPRGSEVVKVGGPARARAIELIKNRRRQYGVYPTSPPYCRLRFLISFPVRALADPSRLTFYADAPRTLHRTRRDAHGLRVVYISNNNPHFVKEVADAKRRWRSSKKNGGNQFSEVLGRPPEDRRSEGTKRRGGHG